MGSRAPGDCRVLPDTTFCTGKWIMVNHKNFNRLATCLAQGSGFSYPVKIQPEVI